MSFFCDKFFKYIMFLKFFLLSGVGWLIDIFTFFVLTEFVSTSVVIANYISSFFGLTFVLFSSRKAIFDDATGWNSRQSFSYLCYHFLSISVYSFSLGALAGFLINWLGGHNILISAALVAKLIITPLNLVTNYIFIRLLYSALFLKE